VDIFRLRELDISETSSSSSPQQLAAVDATGQVHREPSAMPALSLRGRPGWGDRSVSRLLAAVDSARHIADHRCVENDSYSYLDLGGLR
jgi:hypothetical protein